MVVYLLRSGKAFNIYSLGTDDCINYLDYYQKLETRDQNKFESLIERLADFGKIHDEKKFRYLGKEVYELKTPNAKRLYCFWSNNKHLTGAIIVSHGTDKLPKKKLNREIEKVANIIKRFKNSILDIRTINNKDQR